jgi:hypothetical protein
MRQTTFEHCRLTTLYRLISSDIENGCDIDLKISNFKTLGDERVWIALLSLEKLEETAASKGFHADPARGWEFAGNPMGIYFKHFKKLSFETEQRDGGVTLIGRQTETAADRAGSSGVFEGVHILRITRTHIVSVDLPFAYKTPAKTRGMVVRDLVNLVNSVHVTSFP